jgi:hypothetical protein
MRRSAEGYLFLRRMNRLKLIPQITSRDCMKFNVANGIGGRLDYAV